MGRRIIRFRWRFFFNEGIRWLSDSFKTEIENVTGDIGYIGYDKMEGTTKSLDGLARGFSVDEEGLIICPDGIKLEPSEFINRCDIEIVPPRDLEYLFEGTRKPLVSIINPKEYSLLGYTNGNKVRDWIKEYNGSLKVNMYIDTNQKGRSAGINLGVPISRIPDFRFYLTWYQPTPVEPKSKKDELRERFHDYDDIVLQLEKIHEIQDFGGKKCIVENMDIWYESKCKNKGNLLYVYDEPEEKYESFSNGISW